MSCPSGRVATVGRAGGGGPQQQGKRRTSSVVFYGRQAGQVMLSDRKLQVERPRLRTKGLGRTKEVEIPAYTAMQDQSPLGAHMLDTLLHGVPRATIRK